MLCRIHHQEEAETLRRIPEENWEDLTHPFSLFVYTYQFTASMGSTFIKSPKLLSNEFLSSL